MGRAIVIQSLGKLDIEAITLMGMSSKRDDPSKIGMFGTGIKYALAKLLRDGIRFRLWDGERDIDVSTRDVSFKGRQCKQMMVNGETTSITTEMGPQWESWWVVREFLSNARDEQVHEFYVCEWEDVKMQEGWTAVVLDYDPFEQVWLNRERYFLLDRRAKWEGGDLKILPKLGDGTRVYKNGILVHEDTKEDAYDYDLASAELNEMRELRYEWTVPTAITKTLLQMLSDARMATDYMAKMSAHLRYNKQVYTGNIASYEMMGAPLSDAWKEAIDAHEGPVHNCVGESLPSDGIILPTSLANIVNKHINRNRKLELCDPTPEQRCMIDSVLGKLYASNVEISSSIKVADTGPQIIAQVLADNIILHQRLAFASEQVLTEALLEEEMHILTKQDDATRAFPDSIFSAWARSVLASSPTKMAKR